MRTKKLNSEQLTALLPMIRKKKKGNRRKVTCSMGEKNDALPGRGNLQKEYEGRNYKRRRSVRRYRERPLTGFKPVWVVLSGDFRPWAADHHSLRGSEEGENNIEESGSQCR